MLNNGMFIFRLHYLIITITITPFHADVLHVNNAIKNANIVIFPVQVNIFSSAVWKGKTFWKIRKLKNVAPSTEKEATNVNSTCLGLSCKRDELKVVHLQNSAKCRVGLYCSLKSKEADSKNHEIFVKTIIEQKSVEGNKTFVILIAHLIPHRQ